MIIVEGPDNSGKTTLINDLKHDFDQYAIFDKSPSHLVIGDNPDLVSWITWIETSLIPENRSVIYDRHPIISESVYGPVCRDENLLEETGYWDILKSLKPLIIICRPSSIALFNIKTKQPKFVLQKHKEIVVAYDKLYTKLVKEGFDVAKYIYTENDYASIYQVVYNHLSGGLEEI